MAHLLYRLGRFAARRAWVVIAAWVAALMLAGGAFAVAGGQLTNTMSIPGTETQRLADRLQSELPQAANGTGRIVFATEDGEPFTTEQREQIGAALAATENTSGVEEMLNPFTAQQQRQDQAQQLTDAQEQLSDGREQLAQAQQTIAENQAKLDAARERAEEADAPAPSLRELDTQQQGLDEARAQLEDQREELEAAAPELQRGQQLLALTEDTRTVAEDGTAAVAVVSFTAEQQAVTAETKEALQEVINEADIDGVQVEYSTEISQDVSQLFGPAEVIGVIVAGVVLLVMLGTLVAAGLPILTALTGVGIGALTTLAFSGVVEMASVTPMLGLMLGLAVGIDYSLFILNRHRQQLLAGTELHESIGLATGTAGNAVVFAGLTVIIALAALNVTGIGFLGLMGTAAATCVAVAVLIAITLTPALLSLMGQRLLSARARERAARTPAHAAPHRDGPALRHPILTLLAGLVVLGTIAVPTADMRLGLPDASSEPADSTAYQAYRIIEEKFGAGANGPLLVVADLPEDTDEAEATDLQVTIGQELLEQQDVVSVVPAGLSEDRRTAVFQVTPDGGPADESTENLVNELRELSPELEEAHGVSIGVTGLTGGNIDVSQKLAEALPLYLTVVLGLSLLLLVLVFRSILVPLIATAGFLLTLFAALGGVVAIYQWGWLGWLFGVHDPGPVISFLPTLLIGILFGLAMDYQLFLVSGMREAWVHGSSSRAAVREGLNAGRAVVTAAAIIMISVFAGFMFSHTAMIRPMGFGLAFGVLVDAFVVRMMLVPAAMHLLGDKAWWLPRWLDRALPNVDVEGESLRREHAPAAREPERELVGAGTRT
ncbi:MULTISPECIES: MMPL family transporter [Kocuria]|jgi:RND superfamily putative drug exporter|uniref:MMPL family transporter n=1 Tax=Kocuria TaxID=57493 RepID=UPI000BAB64A2|nr:MULTISPECIES: MMPL family transporter [Kocuria]MEB2529097.1 MMPL family transporter [Kocuria rosea]MEB2618413.1 MMPL family transporter [Kocuria rosea]NVC25440.1 MMPL family transporter [Kocuria salina]PAU85080.1 RND transporter [Kocuria sp. WN036]THE18668.1 MMPL family transporter [Kocuria rosea]